MPGGELLFCTDQSSMCIGRLGEDISGIWIAVAIMSTLSLRAAFAAHAETPVRCPIGIARLTLFAWAAAASAFAIAFVLFVPLAGHPTALKSMPGLWSLWVLVYLSLLLCLSVALVTICVSFGVLRRSANSVLNFARVQVLVFVAVTLAGILVNFPEIRPSLSPGTCIVIAC